MYRQKTTLVLCLLLLLAGRAEAQGADTLLTNFKALRVENTVRLDWTVRYGSVCMGITIERSEDSLIFTEVGEIEGVCGSATHSISYSYTDSFPLANRVNYYRLYLGGYGYTKTVAADFSGTGQTEEFKVWPNPLTSSAGIYIPGRGGQEFSFVLVDGSGAEVVRHDHVNSGYLPLEKGTLKPGVYIYLVTGGTGLVARGKIVIL